MPHWLGASLSHAFALTLLPSDAGRTRVRHIELQIGILCSSVSMPQSHEERATGNTILQALTMLGTFVWFC